MNCAAARVLRQVVSVIREPGPDALLLICVFAGILAVHIRRYAQAKISHSGVVFADSADQRADVVDFGIIHAMRRDQGLQPMLQRPLGVLPDCQVAAVSRCHILNSSRWVSA